MGAEDRSYRALATSDRGIASFHRTSPRFDLRRLRFGSPADMSGQTMYIAPDHSQSLFSFDRRIVLRRNAAELMIMLRTHQNTKDSRLRSWTVPFFKRPNPNLGPDDALRESTHDQTIAARHLRRRALALALEGHLSVLLANIDA